MITQMRSSSSRRVLLTIFIPLVLFALLRSLMATVRSDVTFLREQYEAGKSQAKGLKVFYNGKQVHDGEEWKKDETQVMPKVDIQIESDPKNPFWTLVMADPDAPQRGNEKAGPWLHWIQATFQGNHPEQGKTLADYQGPAPPLNTGPHQYIFLLYKSSTGDINQSGGSIAVSDSNKRKQFGLKQFEEEHQLHLVATISYTVLG